MSGTPMQKCVQALQTKMAMFGKSVSVKEATKQCSKKFSQNLQKMAKPKRRNIKPGL